MPNFFKKNIMFKFFHDMDQNGGGFKVDENGGDFKGLDIRNEIKIIVHASETTGLVYDYTWHPDNGGELIIKGQNNDPDSLMRGIYKLRGGRQSAKIDSIRSIINRQTGCHVKISEDQASIAISDILPRDTFRCHPHYACEPFPNKQILKIKRCNNRANIVKKKKRRIHKVSKTSASSSRPIRLSDNANSSPIYDPSIPSTCPMGAFAIAHGRAINHPRDYNRSPMEPSADPNSSAIYDSLDPNIWPMGVSDNADTGDLASVACGAVADNRINPVPPPAGLGQPHTADLEKSSSSSSGSGVGDSCEPIIPSIDPWPLGSSTGSPSGNNSAVSSVSAGLPSADSDLESDVIKQKEDQSLKYFSSLFTAQDEKIISGSAVEGGSEFLI